jgi:deoxyribonuclease-4
MGVKSSPLGVHTSIAGGVSKAVDRALLLGCNAIQIFVRNPRSWPRGRKENSKAMGEAERFKKKREEAGLWPLVIHTSYIINLSSPDGALFKRSRDLFIKELGIAGSLGADYIVVHPGSSKGKGVKGGRCGGFGIRRVTEALNGVAGLKPGPAVEILLENTAGGGHQTGSSLADIGTIIDKVKGLKLGLCFDTCHGFQAGYPMKTPGEAAALVKAIDKAVGLKRLKLVHLNDSRTPLDSRVDRHQHIGKGMIGSVGLGAFLKNPGVRGVPVILETPKKTERDDPRNLKVVRDMLNLPVQSLPVQSL